MGVGETLRALLVADAGVVALVSERIYPLVLKQDCAKPAVAYSVISSQPVGSYAGGPVSGRRVLARVQFDCYASTYLEAHAVADAVDAVISDLARSDLSATLEQSQDLRDDETELFRVSADYLVFA